MNKTIKIECPLIRNYLRAKNLPTMILIKYLLDEVKDFKNIKLNQAISKTSLQDLGITKAYFEGFTFCYELRA
jgi:hypothetical protein